MKSLIAIIPLYDETKNSYWMLPGYMQGIEMAGGLPIMLPLSDDEQLLMQVANTFDGFLFTGGHDVSPALYNQQPIEQCGMPCLKRDSMEKKLFELVLKQNKPALGICRGIQLFNVLSGGTLYQDLPAQKPSTINHHQTLPYDHPIHQVKLVDDTPLSNLLKEDVIAVNSYHHQAIKDLAPTFKAMAYSEDYLIEAIYHPDKKFIWAVQWHPEFSYQNDQNSQKILSAFVCACKKGA